MHQHDATEALVQSLLETTAMYLGAEDSLRALEVNVSPARGLAIVTADLRESSVDAQIDAVQAFFQVQECFADELQVELRFGSNVADIAAADAKQGSRVLTA